MKRKIPRSKATYLLISGATLAAIVAYPLAGGAASLSNSQFHIRAVNSEQPKDFSAIRPFFEGKKAPTTPPTTTPPTTEPTTPPTSPGTTPAPEPTTPPVVTPPKPVDPMPTSVVMTINTALPGCKPSGFNLEFTGSKFKPNAVISWGDGTSSTTVTDGGVISHSYRPGIHSLHIEGKIEGITRSAATSATVLASNSCLQSLDHFGSKTEVTDLRWMLKDAVNIRHVEEPPVTVRSLRGLFAGATNYNEDISGWDMSNVTDTSEMFLNTRSFNQDISSWDMSSVTDTNFMFSGAQSFNQDISRWNVGNVTNFSSMFYGATSFDRSLAGWNTSKGRNFGFMFSSASAFSQDLSSWDMRNAEILSGMFSGATVFNGDVANWKAPKVTAMSSMFNRAESFNRDISEWQTGGVTSFNQMFSGARSFNQNISGWNTSSATNMSSMFNSASSFDQDLSNWSVAKVVGSNSKRDFAIGSKLTAAKLPRWP